MPKCIVLFYELLYYLDLYFVDKYFYIIDKCHTTFYFCCDYDFIYNRYKG